MILDAHLAALHHLLAFALVGMLVSEWVLLRGEVSASAVARLVRTDLLYGLTAGMLIAVGIDRVFFGIKGAAYYGGSWVFWLKMAAFAAAGLLSIKPTLAFIRWSRTLRDGGGLPTDQSLRSARRIVAWEMHLVAVEAITAAFMARGLS